MKIVALPLFLLMVALGACARDAGPAQDGTDTGLPATDARDDGHDDDADGDDATDGEDFTPCIADTLTDVNHCGGCGNVCPSGPRSTPRCTAGRCSLVCQPGFSNDNGNPDDGCEAGCVPASSPDESVCDARDDDCDGEVDEDWRPTSTCGVGGCAREAWCSPQGVQCESGSPSPDDDCDGIDDDCDAEVDEDWRATSCGLGPCSRTSRCVDGQELACEFVPPSMEADTVCNGIDDDCDGEVDEDWDAQTAGPCGTGACATLLRCDGGQVICTPGLAGAEVCNGVDDDCDGRVDEELGCRPLAGDLQECRVTAETYTLAAIHGRAGVGEGDVLCELRFGAGWFWGPAMRDAPEGVRQSLYDNLSGTSTRVCHVEGTGATVYPFWAGSLGPNVSLDFTVLGFNWGGGAADVEWLALACSLEFDVETCRDSMCSGLTNCSEPCPTAPLLCCR